MNACVAVIHSHLRSYAQTKYGCRLLLLPRRLRRRVKMARVITRNCIIVFLHIRYDIGSGMDNEHVTYRKACIQKSWTQTEHKRRKSKKVKGIAD